MQLTDLQRIKQQRNELKLAYSHYNKRKQIFFLILIPLGLCLALFAITMGSANISFNDVFSALFSRIIPSLALEHGHADMIIWKLRLPRVLMGFLAGIALGCCGAVMQGILRNPLADPYILGISSAAGFGASLAIVLGVGVFSGPYLIIGNAFVFSLLSSFLILILSSRKSASPQTMVLTGLALLFFFQAMTTMIQYFGDSEAVKAALFWTVGDLGKVDWNKLALTAPLVILGTVILLIKAHDLNLMNAGDESAQSLGINVKRTRTVTMIICSLMVAGIVSFTGTIGFIGLVAPHLVRLIAGSDNKILIPASGLTGAILLVTADTIARTILSPVILPVGSVTAFLGVPLFVYLIIKRGGTIL